LLAAFAVNVTRIARTIYSAASQDTRKVVGCTMLTIHSEQVLKKNTGTERDFRSLLD
jgi:hypothetical protein